MSDNQTAEAILIVIKKLAKWSLILLLIISIFIVGGEGLGYLFKYYTYERHKNKITLIASFNKEKCSNSDYPLLVHIINKSSKKILNVYFDVKVTQIGRSTQLNEYDTFNSDTILEPNNGYWSCWRVLKKNHYYEKRAVLSGENMAVEAKIYRIEFSN